MTSHGTKKQSDAPSDFLRISPKDLPDYEGAAAPEGFFCTADLREILERISEQEEAVLNAPEEPSEVVKSAPYFLDPLQPVSVPLLYAK